MILKILYFTTLLHSKRFYTITNLEFQIKKKEENGKRKRVGQSKAKLISVKWIEWLHLVFVEGLRGRIDAEEIRRVFSRYGRVIDMHVPTRDGATRRFAFVRFLLFKEIHRVIR